MLPDASDPNPTPAPWPEERSPAGEPTPAPSEDPADTPATTPAAETPSAIAARDAGTAAPSAASVPVDPNAERPLKARVIDTIATIYDPEIPVNIYELGLIYTLDVDADTGHVKIDMTLTSPACPVAGTLPGEVEEKVRGVDGVESVVLELVWEPPWDKEKLSEAAKLQLGLL